MDMLQNLSEVRNNIKAAAQRSGIVDKEITLIAVSKTKPIEMLKKANHLGVNTFGENKVQEVMDKYYQIQNVEWHFIGKLQRNKVKYIIDKVCLIHSLDSVSLAEEINKRACNKGIIANVLIQINIGKEETKSGIYEEDLNKFIHEIKDFENIKVCGLMAIPPKCSEDKIRGYFRDMKSLFNSLKRIENKNLEMKYLSMGMTGDYEIAIEEGSNMIRVGTGIFGERDYQK